MSAASLSTPDCPHRRGDAPTPAKPVRSRVGAFAARAPIAALVALALALASCASGPPPDAFELSAAKPPPSRPLSAQLRVAEPIASLDLDSDRILVRTGPEEVATLAGAKWSDRLPLLVQSRLTQTFENANLLRQVSRRPTTTADYELDIEIRKFELDVAQMQVKVDLAAKIVSVGSGRVAAAQIFTADAPVGSTGGADVSAALNAALSSVMTRIVAFASSRL
ncbi:MAG: ABC-type transport auxiliary lipoprotein family protein [Roseiarcus sp.]|jgi:cholesterol transport system auxiliary component